MNQPVVAAPRRPVAVRRDTQPRVLALVAREVHNQLALDEVPQLDLAVHAAAEDMLALRRQRDAPHRGSVIAQFLQHLHPLIARRVPQADDLVLPAAQGQVAVRRNGDGGDFAVGPLDVVNRLALLVVPQADVTVLPAGEEGVSPGDVERDCPGVFRAAGELLGRRVAGQVPLTHRVRGVVRQNVIVVLKGRTLDGVAVTGQGALLSERAFAVGQHGELAGRPQAEEVDRAVGEAHGKMAAVGAERDGVQPVAHRPQLADLAARRVGAEVPQTQATVTAGRRDHAAVRPHGDLAQPLRRRPGERPLDPRPVSGLRNRSLPSLPTVASGPPFGK